MRRQHHKPESSIFASTRIAVALCAAIAMILGAMSVGAARDEDPVLVETPVATVAPILSNRSVINSPEASDGTNTLPLNVSYAAQTPLATNRPIPQQVLLVNPKRPRIDVSLGPIKKLMAEEKLKIELDVPVPALVPLATPVPVEAITVEGPTVPELPHEATDQLPAILQPSTDSGESLPGQAEQHSP